MNQERDEYRELCGGHNFVAHKIAVLSCPLKRHEVYDLLQRSVVRNDVVNTEGWWEVI